MGIGPNKLVAKIASDFQKPDGLMLVRAEEVQPFLDPLRIRVIPGIGPKTERFLHERHIRTVADLRTLERALLAEWLGRGGEDLFAKARGLSESAVSNDRERNRHPGRGVRAGARPRAGREGWTGEEAVCATALELLLPFLDDRENPRHRKLRLIRRPRGEALPLTGLNG